MLVYFTSRAVVGCRQGAAVNEGNVPCVQVETTVMRERKKKNTKKNIHIIRLIGNKSAQLFYLKVHK